MLDVLDKLLSRPEPLSVPALPALDRGPNSGRELSEA
jgi:hypothetical protein